MPPRARWLTLAAEDFALEMRRTFGTTDFYDRAEAVRDGYRGSRTTGSEQALGDSSAAQDTTEDTGEQPEE